MLCQVTHCIGRILIIGQTSQAGLVHAALHGDLEMGAATMHIMCKWSQVADFIPIYRRQVFYILYHIASLAEYFIR